MWSALIIEQVLIQSLKSRDGQTIGRVVTEFVHLQWFKLMHRCSEVYESLVSLIS